jgi:alkaline phosphatase
MSQLKKSRLIMAVFLLWILPAPSVLAKDVKHIILFIGDGMQAEHEVATSRYLFGKDFALSFHQMPYEGNVTTWDVSTYNKYAPLYGAAPYSAKAIVPVVGYDPSKGGILPYPLQTTGFDFNYFSQGGKWFATDSASAGTAWATGYKTDDGNLAWLPGDPGDGKLKTVAEILRDMRGFSIGVVSTVPFTHATPAAHVSHNASRNNYPAIAEEILKTVKPDVVIGGGHRGWGGNYVSQPLMQEFQNGLNPDYLYVERKAGVAGAPALLQGAVDAVKSGKKLFGLFGGAGGNFESPMPVNNPGNPAIVRATMENPLLSETIEPALKVLSQDPDGFFVMIEQGDIDWAAHANDFPRIVGTTWDLHMAVEAAMKYIDKPGDDVNWGNTLLLVTSDHGNSYLRLNPEAPMSAGEMPTKPELNTKISFATGSHTNELTRLYGKGHAIGHLNKYEGEWYPCTKIIDNTQIFHIMLDAAGVSVPSPLTVKDTSLSCSGAVLGRAGNGR